MVCMLPRLFSNSMIKPFRLRFRAAYRARIVVNPREHRVCWCGRTVQYQQTAYPYSNRIGVYTLSKQRCSRLRSADIQHWCFVRNPITRPQAACLPVELRRQYGREPWNGCRGGLADVYQCMAVSSMNKAIVLGYSHVLRFLQPVKHEEASLLDRWALSCITPLLAVFG